MNNDGINRATVAGSGPGSFCAGDDPRLESISTGFVSRTDSAISLVGNTFTITGTNFVIWPTLVTKMLKSTESAAITNVVGLHWIYYNAAGFLTVTPPALGVGQFPGFDKCLVATVYWDGAKAVTLNDERHGNILDSAAHEWMHDTVGTRYESGFALTRLTSGLTGALATDAQVVVDGGTLHDEDLTITVLRGVTSLITPFTQEIGLVAGAFPAKLPVYYRTGADGHWTKDVATSYPVKTSGVAGTRIAYNKDTVGTWSAADPGTNGAIVAMWIMATNDSLEPVIAIMGQRYDSTGNTAAILLAAQNNNIYQNMLQGGMPFPEMRLLYRVLVKTDTGYANAIKASIVQVDDYRTATSLPTSNYVATSHASLGGRSDPNAHPASAIALDVTNFTGALRVTEDTAQLAFNRLSKNNAEGGRWWKAEGTFAASGDHAITTTGLSDFYPRVGQAIKLFSSLGVVCEKSSGTYVTSVASMLGVTTAHLTTPRKSLWFELVATPALHINVYGTELGSLDPVPVLLAHTGTIASSTDYVLTADNASGLSGSIAVTYAAVIVDGSKTVVEYFRHNIVSAIAPGVVTYRGQACAAPTEVWLGSPDCVKVQNLSIPGNWSSPASQTAYKDKLLETPRWAYGDGTIVYALSKTDTEDTGATKAKAGVTVELVSVTNAIPATTVALTDTFDEFPDAPLRHIKHLDRLSVYTVAGTVGDGKNLTYLAFVVVY